MWLMQALHLHLHLSPSSSPNSPLLSSFFFSPSLSIILFFLPSFAQFIIHLLLYLCHHISCLSTPSFLGWYIAPLYFIVHSSVPSHLFQALPAWKRWDSWELRFSILKICPSSLPPLTLSSSSSLPASFLPVFIIAGELDSSAVPGKKWHLANSWPTLLKRLPEPNFQQKQIFLHKPLAVHFCSPEMSPKKGQKVQFFWF